MSRIKSKTALTIVTKLWNNAHQNSLNAGAMDIELGTASFKRSRTNGIFQFIPEKNVIHLNSEIFKNSSAGERKLIIQIISELKKNNCLWHFDYRSNGIKGTSKERGILTLRKKEIPFKTENQSLHIVNPFYLRRGSIYNVIAASNNLLRSIDILSKKAFKHLENPNSAKKDLFTDSLIM